MVKDIIKACITINLHKYKCVYHGIMDYTYLYIYD